MATPSTRMFGGKKYTIYTEAKGLSFKKDKAVRVATQLRKEGWKARVIQYGLGEYAVYRRGK